MMNGPFFRNFSNQQPSQSPRSVPVHKTHHRPSPKVVSVPVHFVSSDQPQTTMSVLKESSAIKIQKVFRGYVIRKSVMKITSIRNDVCEIEQRIEDNETVELIRKDAKERLRVNETIMGLLFKLDSIRGVDCGIRELRKGVTKKAIALQEKVDSIDHHQTFDDKQDSGKMDVEDESAGKEVVKEVVTNCDPVNVNEFEEKDDTTTQDLEKYKEGDCFANYDKGNREILKNLMDDNEKMMKLMTQMSERNEMQTRIINSLSRRVEQLEKALVTRRKKKEQVSLRKRRDKDCFYI